MKEGQADGRFDLTRYAFVARAAIRWAEEERKAMVARK
jgi:hypothetical protein